ncbi:MAG: dihydrodipicolinate synthase family protein [Clostridiales bacterium]|nr:dihydrodipicolinate synthase family protein [Clostridiales bacterium]
MNTMNNIVEKLKCVTPAILTPLNKDETIDEMGLRRVVRNVVDAGMKTIFALGYTGEVRAFAKEERRRVIEIVRDEAGADILIVAGALGDSTLLIEEHCEAAYEAGADMVLITPTDFFFLNDTELEELFVRLNDTVKLPIMIYNCPENHHYVTPDMLSRLSKLEKIQALKQSTTTDKIQSILLKVDPKENFIMVSGDEFEFFPAMCLGVEGFIMGGPGNITPGMCVSMLESYKKGDFEAARAEYMRFVAFYEELYNSLPYNVIAVIKAAMEVLGVCDRQMRHPVRSVSDQDMEKIREMMIRHGILK